MKKYTVLTIITTGFIILFLSFTVPSTRAQDEQPPELTQAPDEGWPIKPLNPHMDASQRREARAEERERLEEKAASVQAPEWSSGPDDYGYTFTDQVAYSWIDAKALGANSGLYGDDVSSGPVNIGFTFPFYENAYTQVYFNTNGLVTFGAGSASYTDRSIPNQAPPNNLIAALWEDYGMYYDSRPTSGVFIYRGGAAPNRFMVIEWYSLNSFYPPYGWKDLTFEVILQENGDIVTQYQTLASENSFYASVGIEDSQGMDGLQYMYNNYVPQLTGRAIHFYRPGNQARVKASPLYQGKFTKAGERASFTISVKNTGSLGHDTYDFIPTYIWPLQIYDSRGVPFTDTNGNGLVDTGPLSQGASKTVVVKVSTPMVAAVGEHHNASLIIRSTLDSTQSKTADLRSSIPAPFAQVYSDLSDGAMNLFLVRPDQQTLKPVSPAGTNGYSLAIAEAPNGNLVYAWYAGRCLDLTDCEPYVEEIYYSIYDRSGNAVRSPTKLADHSAASLTTYDFDVSVTVSPSGKIGLTWTRELYDGNTGLLNDNVYFAILDPSGSLVFGPLNLTNNLLYGYYDTVGLPQFYDTRIIATSDNRYFLAWQRYSNEYNGNNWNRFDIYIAVRDQAGGQVKAVTLTTNAMSDQFFYLGGLASLASGRVWLGYEFEVETDNTGFFIYDSNGNGVKFGTINPAYGGGYYGSDMDAVQLSDGRILVGMASIQGYHSNSYYAILDGSTYNVITAPTSLDYPTGISYCENMSVAADQAAHGILTCTGVNTTEGRSYLLYALVDSAGSTITPLMVYRNAQTALPFFNTSYLGYGSTSYSLPATTPNVDTYISSSALVLAPPSGSGKIMVHFGNAGSTTAESVQVKASLDPSLTYLSTTSDISPTVNGSEVTWTIPQALPFMSTGYFEIMVSVPGVPVRTRFPVTLTISSEGSEASPIDNTFNLDIIVAEQVFLPFQAR